MSQQSALELPPVWEKSSPPFSIQKNNPKGTFIVFEGCDCCGKGTQLARTKDWLESLGKEVVVCSDPGTTQLGSELRKLLKNKNLPMNTEAQILLFTACRSELSSEIILPALAENKIVLCDRFLYSTLIYQCFAKSEQQIDNLLALNQMDNAADLMSTVWFGMKHIVDLHKNCQCAIPDLTLIFDISSEQYNQRRSSGRSGENDRFENDSKESIQFMEYVRRGYRYCFDKMSKGSFSLGTNRLLNGNRSVDEVFADTSKIISRFLRTE